VVLGGGLRRCGNLSRFMYISMYRIAEILDVDVKEIIG